MKITPEILRILEADLGTDYDPVRALEFLRSLNPGNRGLPEADRLETLLHNPPLEDVHLQTIYETPFVRGEIVVAGKDTRKKHPLTQYHPIHFKKTYRERMAEWETPTSHEEHQNQLVWQHFQEENAHHKVPLALGSSPNVFRSELVQAKTLRAVSPVHNSNDPEALKEQIKSARAAKHNIAKLWDGLESLWDAMETLHNGGMLHNDAHTENLMLSTNPDGTFSGHLIDFETTEEDDRFGTLAWNRATAEDNRFLIEEATLIRMCARPGEITRDNTPLGQAVKACAASSPKILAVRELLKKEREAQQPTIT